MVGEYSIEFNLSTIIHEMNTFRRSLLPSITPHDFQLSNRLVTSATTGLQNYIAQKGNCYVSLTISSSITDKAVNHFKKSWFNSMRTQVAIFPRATSLPRSHPQSYPTFPPKQMEHFLVSLPRVLSASVTFQWPRHSSWLLSPLFFICLFFPFFTSY